MARRTSVLWGAAAAAVAVLVLSGAVGARGQEGPCTTVEQVHVVFRHGEKTPEKETSYPTDPYINETWYPLGPGVLTTNGKMQEFNIGVTLRKRYNALLGKVFHPDILYARSTNSIRTKMSMQLALAGLWPPSSLQSWNDVVSWQPIPYDYEKSTDPNEVLGFPVLNCPRYSQLYIDAQNTDDVQNFKKDNQEMLEFIAGKSGLGLEPIYSFFLYNSLHSEKTNGKVLPDWTNGIYPGFLQYISMYELYIQTYTPEMIQFTGGRLLRKILSDAQDKIKSTLRPADRKLFMYAGHEVNVAYTLRALNVYTPQVPPYAAYVILELHKFSNNRYGFKILYQNYKTSEPQPLTIPGCTEICPIEEFSALLKDNIAYDIKC